MFGLARKTTEDGGRIGIALKGDHVALAVVRRTRDTVSVERCERLPLDPARGQEAVAAALRAARMPRLPLSTVLQPEDYRLALVEAPDVPPAELRAAMRWRLKEIIDFRVEDAVIDVFDLPPQNRGGQGRTLYAVAARRETVARHAAGLAGVPDFDVVDVPELCLRNLAAALPDSTAGIAMLHVVERAATIVLVRGRTFYLSRQMAMRASPGADPAPDPGAIALELQRSLDYYERHFDQPPITRVAISSCTDAARELTERLHADSGLKVESIDLNRTFVCSTPIDPVLQDDCILAVGAAMRRQQRTL